MLKLLACFDEATVSLYFCTEHFGENKHKPIVS